MTQVSGGICSCLTNPHCGQVMFVWSFIFIHISFDKILDLRVKGRGHIYKEIVPLVPSISEFEI